MNVFKRIFTKQYIVADTGSDYILYHQKNYENVIESFGFATPMPIASFRTFKEASKFLKQKCEERFNELENIRDFGVDYGEVEDIWEP